MSLATYPLIAWGDPDDMQVDWTAVGAVVSSGYTDPFGGAAAYVLQDDDGAAIEYVKKIVAFSGDGTQWIYGCFRQNTTDQTALGLFQVVDETASVERGGASLTFSGSTLEASIYGSATQVVQVDIGDSWYFVAAEVPSVVAANTNSLRIYPAITSAATTASMRAYMRPIVLLDYIDDYRLYATPRDGYAAVESGSGVRDAWDQGTNYIRSGTAAWVPPLMRAAPAIVSGYRGPHESTGANCGVEAMLLAGWEMQSLVWVPDRSNCRVSQSAYLTSPTAGWAPSQQPNGDYSIALELVSTSAPGAVA